jgi:ATP sulfurylase
MKTLTCDVCKHTIQQPVANRNYFHLAHRDLCEHCKDQLDSVLKPVIRTKQPFDYDWYDRVMQDFIEKAIIKGGFDSKK